MNVELTESQIDTIKAALAAYVPVCRVQLNNYMAVKLSDKSKRLVSVYIERLGNVDLIQKALIAGGV